MSGTPSEHPRAKGGSARGRQMSASRVRDLISASIREGHLDPDEPLAEEHLMTLFAASRGSVRAALSQLRDSGFVERKPRVGTRATGIGFVLPLADIDTATDYPDGAIGRGAAHVTITITEEREVPAFPLVRDRLGLVDPTVRMVENTFTADGEVVGVRTAYYSTSYGFDPRDILGPLSMREIIERYFREETGAVHVQIGADQADAHTARLLGVAEGTPLIVREMTYVTPTGSAIQIVFDRYRGDRVRLESTAVVD
ncbi:transcriptional regulator, GntR family [Rathayibacter oskolensis]|uniref:Transcriptional regulator, GntR family n=1 Tax=Rathayibacter oskolensis TaxID=1891671 RepID=A0A1X7NZG1_9MICO|nr:GntR family transcriptional regulator [Rathayibacter oskolensis]SMH43237.1 transcriptional regulator, GntR family [Rathayibacter oskolensis]